MKIKFIEPDYYKEFKCIGSKCRSNCCTGNWAIHIDKNTYKKYNKLPKKHYMNKLLKENILIVDKDSTKKYAQFKLAEKNATGKKGCIFQTEEGWCKIHAELGEDYLSNICKIYPRVLNYATFKNSEFDFFEKVCSISCEEVANIFMKKNDYIEYDVVEEEYSKNYIVENIGQNVSLMTSEENREIFKYYTDIKSVSTAIFQNRDYSFEDRLILLAMFCDKLQKIEKEENFSKVPECISNFVNAVDNRIYDDVINMKIDNDIAYSYSFIMLDSYLKDVENRENEKVFDKIFENIEKLGIKTVEDFKNSVLVSNYKNILSEKEIFLEHVFLNEFAVKMMPFYKGYTIFENVQILISMYLLYRLMVSGTIGESEFISDEELVDITAYFGKVIVHSYVIYDMFIKTMKETEIDSLANLIVLIKG